MKISLCLLTFNEIAGCKNDIPLLKKYFDKFDEIYTIDGGSKDGTIEFLKEEGIPVHIQPTRGLNAACHFAVEKCTTDAVIFFHPKGTIPVEDTLKFRELFEAGNDFVIGSRIIKGAVNEEDKQFLKPRKWFVMGLAMLSATLFKRENKILWDVLHGFRGVTLEGYKKMGLKDEGMVTIDIEMVSRSYKAKIKSIEFPTTECPRIAGETHFKAIPTGIKILKYIKREINRKD
ncbi:MAG: Glycosyltransferase, group 2 family protein [Candidatus Wolfebacteria bacterium GW2011_GWC2_39_22]|uniref:Glycosyltransferase, group 2 family protein n=1 Tax=Candidatus Wolfebacteria bacterium GW2011_GWC2_39_22 TaxID=1619013 RepID=A0A0G0NGT8_9BACT|nr:MAG: Glycosyltransferase, group 2 family protein [Candidatus Wolfebacteria bacterium GW2011_GWC2_39_22]